MNLIYFSKLIIYNRSFIKIVKYDWLREKLEGGSVF